MERPLADKRVFGPLFSSSSPSRGPEPDNIEGLTIVEVREMTDGEKRKEAWSSSEDAVVLVLEDGSKIYPTSDTEGNHAGHLVQAIGDKTYHLFAE